MPEQLTFSGFLKNNLYLLLVAAMLFTISFINDNYWANSYDISSESKKLSAYVQEKEMDFYKIGNNPHFVNDIINDQVDDKKFEQFLGKDYFLFFYSKLDSGKTKLEKWNTQYILPTEYIIEQKQNKGFVALSNGYYVWLKSDSLNKIMIALIPVKWNYIVTNEYLENSFISDKNNDNKYEVVEGNAKAGNIIASDGSTLFHLNQIYSGDNFRNTGLSVACRILGVLFLLFFLHVCAVYISINTRFIYAIAFLVSIICILRILTYFTAIPLNFRQFELFDPAVYGSNFILKSLGDLLINAILFLWVVVFCRYHVHERKVQLAFENPIFKWISLIVGTAVIVISTFAGGNIIRSLIADSQISFDVINFFSLNIYTAISFLILSCIAIGYFFLCQIILALLKPLFSKPFIALFLCSAIIALLILSFKIGNIPGGFELYLLVWLMIFLLLLNSDYFYLIASKIVTSRLVFWIFFFSISITSIIIKENNEKEIRNRQHYAEILASKSSPASETLLNTMLTDFRADFLADNFYRFLNENSNQFFKDSLIRNNFSGYTDKYDTRIFTFNNKEQPLFNLEKNNYNDLNTILNTQGKPTGIPGLFYYDVSYEKFNYIIKKTIVDINKNLIGYVFILVNPKFSRTEALSPELFGKGHSNAIENSSTYAFALYNNGKLISSHNDYPFATSYLEKYYAGKQYLMINRNNHSEMWYNAGAGKFVVIVKENSLSIESLTLFSYLFCSFLLLTAIAWLLNILLRSRLNIRKLGDYWQLSIRNQIHGTIIFFSVISFLIIGIATIVFFINRYENNNREKLSSTIRIMEKEVKNSFTKDWFLNNNFQLTDQANQREIEHTINRISEIHGVDVNLYSLDGDLKVSSLPLPYTKGIISKKMEPQAYLHLRNEREIQYFQKETIGKLKYLSSYVPILDSTGDTYAFLNVPYFTSQSKLRDEISNFLVTIINLNAFIFLIAGIVALFITNRITNTFSLIGEKMKKINLEQRNEAIEWHRSDEIGDLVNEYNKMVSKLDESAQALAKTEREGAWREMARQVAHEIKNPLTPMKLSIQFLQKSIENNSPNVKELSINVAKTLVEQIDHLSHIANEFGQFANIGNAEFNKIDLNASLRSIQQLYVGNENVHFEWILTSYPINVMVDKTHVNRLFTNLIQNGIQAVSEGKQPIIKIKDSIDGDDVLIEISDNGEGINESLQSKIFTPNFTTKSSGTGLGLAMCKRIVEQSNGSIYFETSNKTGTTFFVRLPIVED